MVNLGELGSRARPHSEAISFVTNIDFVRGAAMGDIWPDRIWENKSGFGCNIPRYDDFAVWRAEQVLGDGAKQRLLGSNLIGEGQGIDFFIVIYELFQVGIVCSRGVDGFGDAASRLVATWQKLSSKNSLLGELISKITDGSLQKFLRIAEYFVTWFAVLNCLDTLR
ncbi:hypothetical protein [Microcoleus sp. N9_B4]|uniref:hypothetical protein n=1 Tax=Microcoleus sp. N9_B4 TaxID=3055386 RepID=UPI002FCFDC11